MDGWQRDRLKHYLPQSILQAIADYEAHSLPVEEILLHRNEKVLFVCGNENRMTGIRIDPATFDSIFLSLCQGSVYAHTATIAKGYLTTKEGWRVGVCGNAVGELRNLSEVTSLHLRFSTMISSCERELYHCLRQNHFMQSVLIYAPPGIGKTTLLRQTARLLALPPKIHRICVIDTRREIAIPGFSEGTVMDVLSGYPKAAGIEIALRTLSPQYLICDEIGNDDEAEAILSLMHAGVRILATVHGEELSELLLRPAIEKLHRYGVFQLYCGIRRNGKDRMLSLHPREAI